MLKQYTLNSFVLFLCLVWGIDAHVARAQTNGAALPHLQQHGTATQLVVDGHPFLILSGELGNSSASGMAYMQPLWPRFKALSLNIDELFMALHFARHVEHITAQGKKECPLPMYVNGDQGRHLRIPPGAFSIQRVRLYR